MSIHLDQQYQLVGTASPQTVSQTIISPRKDIVMAISVSGPQAIEHIQAISQKVQQVQIQSSASFYSFLQRILEQLSQYEVELSMAWISGEHIVLGAWNADVLLQRNGKIGRVVQAGVEIKMIEGAIQDRDVYMCVTRSASSVLFPELSQNLTEDLATVLPKYVGMIQESGLADRSAGIFFTVVSDAPQETVGAVKGPRQTSTAQSQIGKQILHTFVKSIRLGAKWFANQLRNHPKFRVGFFGILSTVTLVFFINIGLSVKRTQERTTAQTFLNPFMEQLQTIQELEKTDQVAARDQANQLLVELQSQRQQYNQKSVVQEIDRFENQLREYYTSVSGKVEITNLPVFYDFRLIQSDFINNSADIDGAFAVFADKEKKTVILVNTDTKEQKQLPLGEYPSIQDIAFDQEKVWVLGDGIYEYQLESAESPRKVISSDEHNSTGNSLGVFDNSVYVFSAEERNIFRYVKSDEGNFASASAWIQDKQGIDFSKVTSMSIDGAIWLGFQDGKMIKMERGNQSSFEITGIQTPLSSSVYLFTKPDYENIYILEPGAERVVVVRKEGTFLKEVNSPLLATATHLIVREETKKGYVLAGSVVYEVGL